MGPPIRSSALAVTLGNLSKTLAQSILELENSPQSLLAYLEQAVSLWSRPGSLLCTDAYIVGNDLLQLLAHLEVLRMAQQTICPYPVGKRGDDLVESL